MSSTPALGGRQSAAPLDEETSVRIRAASAPQAAKVDGLRAVVWTDGDGELRAARDVCPHRRAPLSAGAVVDGMLRCAYHGWDYDGTGRCTPLPAAGPGGRIPSRAQLEMLALPDQLSAAPAPEVSPTRAAMAPSWDDAGLDDGSVSWLDGDTPALDAFWHAVARRSELPARDESLDVELLGRSWRVARDSGEAWSATAPDGTAAWGAVEHLDHLWVALRQPLAPLPHAAEWGRRGWHHRRLNRAEGRFGVGLLLDNQLDSAHFPFLHVNTFGTAAAVPAAAVERDDTMVSCTMRIPIAATNDPRALAGERHLDQHRVMSYEYHAPLWLRLRLDYEEMGGATVLLFTCVPLGAGRARMDIDVLFHYPDGFTEAQLDARVDFEERVIAEDLRLQRLLDDVRLPLDPRVEIHTKADRLSLECRQVLRELLGEACAGQPSSRG
jgi:phenylpropionate dioxygenase-like ring-hydroxylating dioxygenase large terminal subunit